jgi:molecular chaperone GrpE
MTPDTGSSVPEDPLAPVPDDLLDNDSTESDTPAPATKPADPSAASSPGESVESDGSAPESPGDVEGLIADLERSSRERDEFLEALRRTQADFENYRKRVMKQQADDVARAAESIVEKLLPVLDACDGAVRHGAVEVEPVFAALLGTLEKEGLGRIDPLGEAFDPNQHDAVMHEPAAEGDGSTIVSDVMRPGYSWKGRIVRPAMVKVRG